jgi:hypothetical protein
LAASLLLLLLHQLDSHDVEIFFNSSVSSVRIFSIGMDDAAASCVVVNSGRLEDSTITMSEMLPCVSGPSGGKSARRE